MREGRRGWIGRVAGVAALLLTGFGPFSPPAGARAVVTSTPIQHVVVIYQENHSFDNVLGFWCDQTSRCAGMPSSVRLKSGAVVTPSAASDLVPQLDHSVLGQTTAIDGGRMDGWNQVGGCGPRTKYVCVSGYQPSQIPNLISLAGKFAISDMTLSMADSPSWGGHVYAVAATLDGFTGNNPVPAPTVTPLTGWGCDSHKVTTWNGGAGLQTIPSCIPDFGLGLPNGGAFQATPALYAPTILDELDAARLSWRLYTSGVSKAGGPGTNGAYNWSICPSFAECRDTAQAANMVPTSQVLTDAARGTLPSFSVVLPNGTGTAPTSQHNGTSMTAGDNWIGTLVGAIMSGPEWSSTTVFITYDDCGCFYDHVPPGVNPDGTPQGPRVPLVIVSPYAVSGYTDSTPTTFAGILGYVEAIFGLPHLGVNDAGAYPFTNVFNYSQRPLNPIRMIVRPLPPGTPMTMQGDPNDPT